MCSDPFLQAPTETKKRLALAIVDFLNASLKDGTLTADDAESIEIATSCIADTFQVDPSDQKAVQEALGGQSLVSIYSVYEKLKGRSSASTAGSSSATEGHPSTPTAPKAEPTSSAATADSDKLKSEGNAAMSRKDYPSAITKYTEALNITPGNPIYLSNRAAAYSASGNHSRAAQDAEAASTSDPKYTKAWSRLGLARFALGDAKGAAEAYQKGIDAEGNGGSDAMKRGLETSRKRIEEMEKEENEPPAEAVDDASGAARGGAGGMPDLSALAGMMGGGGGGGGGGGMPDLGSLMSNPMFANMAQNLMSNPDMIGNLMNNPKVKQMMEGFGGPGGAGGEGSGGGGVPDMSTLMSDPSIADM